MPRRQWPGSTKSALTWPRPGTGVGSLAGDRGLREGDRADDRAVASSAATGSTRSVRAKRSSHSSSSASSAGHREVVAGPRRAATRRSGGRAGQRAGCRRASRARSATSQVRAARQVGRQRPESRRARRSGPSGVSARPMSSATVDRPVVARRDEVDVHRCAGRPAAKHDHSRSRAAVVVERGERASASRRGTTAQPRSSCDEQLAAGRRASRRRRRRARRRARGARPRRAARGRRRASPARARSPAGSRERSIDARRRDARPQREARAEVAAHRARVGRGQDDPAARALGVPQRARRAARPPIPWPCSPGLTPSSDRPQTSSRTSASATPTTSPSARLGDPGAVGIGASRWRDARLAALACGARSSSADGGTRRDRGRQRGPADLRGGGHVVGRHRAGDRGGCGHGLGASRRPHGIRSASATLPRRSWPSRSRSSRTAARPSAARSTRSASPAINACPQCHSPRRPHRVCPACGTYAGREVLAPDARHHDHDHD